MNSKLSPNRRYNVTKACLESVQRLIAMKLARQVVMGFQPLTMSFK